MSSRTFKSGLERVFLALGFERRGKVLARHGATVWTLVAQEKGFGNQWSVNVGFWIEGLGGNCPDRVEQSHLYFRLERLFPKHHPTIAAAGELDAPDQPRAYEELVTLLTGPIDADLRKLGTEAGLRTAMAEGRLAEGLITKEAGDRLIEKG